LGAILFRMITGQLPFQGASIPELLYKIVHEPHPPPSTLNPSITSALSTVIDRSLAKDRGARFSSVLEFGAAIRSALGEDSYQPEFAIEAAQPTDEPFLVGWAATMQGTKDLAPISLPLDEPPKKNSVWTRTLHLIPKVTVLKNRFWIFFLLGLGVLLSLGTVGAHFSRLAGAP